MDICATSHDDDDDHDDDHECIGMFPSTLRGNDTHVIKRIKFNIECNSSNIMIKSN